MELNFTEIGYLDNVNNKNSFNYNETQELNQPKYWEQTTQKKPAQHRKKVTFDDILSNMNLVVNQNGVLQSMTPLHQYDQTQYEQTQYKQENYQNQVPVQKKYEPIDHSVKHSYIFNKYFKDYKDANDNFKPQPKVPKTIEEYKQMVMEEKIRQFQERIRISKIKSTKMLFTGNPNISHNRIQPAIRATKNNLRSMKFG